MPFVRDIKESREYLHKVLAYADHHADKAYAIVASLYGWIVCYSDNAEFRARSGIKNATGNVAYVTINGVNYSFNYDHQTQTVKAYRRVGMNNVAVAEFTGSMTPKQIEYEFECMRNLKSELIKKYLLNQVLVK
jgi:hypothetical protein